MWSEGRLFPGPLLQLALGSHFHATWNAGVQVKVQLFATLCSTTSRCGFASEGMEELERQLLMTGRLQGVGQSSTCEKVPLSRLQSSLWDIY